MTSLFPLADLPWALLATAVIGLFAWFYTTADRTPHDPGPLTEQEIDEHADRTAADFEAYAKQEHNAGQDAGGDS
jgi:hypothetical protein